MEYTPGISSLSNLIYKPLDRAKKEIRVLSLQPGISHEDLVGSLSVTALTLNDSIQHYEAISYCWEDASRRDRMGLDGLSFDAPASAVAALRGLRHENECRILWIDAICINQEDVGERAQQVAIMAHVYRNAVLTNVWLGEPDSETKEAVDCLQNSAAEIERNPLIKRRYLNPEQYAEEVETIQRMQLPKDLNAKLLVAIFSRPWFTRLWVFQEVAISTACICHIGSFRFDWWRVELVSQLITWKYDQLFETNPPRRVRAAFTMPTMVRVYQNEPDDQKSLGTLVLNSSFLTATDPRDHVFGHFSPDFVG